VNAVQGTSRAFLLQNLSVEQYLLWSRVIGWPLSIAMFAVTYVLIGRAVRQSVQSRAMPAEEDTPDKDR
jgi:hypothetical protein